MSSRNFRKLIQPFFLLLFFSGNIHAQHEPTEALNKLNEKYPQEKIYLWFNKAAYVAGETIWFKAYLFSGYAVSLISHSLYVEFYDRDKNLIDKKLLPVVSGASEGSIDIDEKGEEGVYFIRAYTQWMLNFKPEFQYIRPVLIYNPASSKKLTINNSLVEYEAIPEGGTLISGLHTKVAVRRIADAPLAESWSGYLYEEGSPGIKMAEFTPMDPNVALFSFTPEYGKKYYIYIRDPANRTKICPLPPVRNNGISLSVKSVNDTVFCRVKMKDLPDTEGDFTLIGEVQGEPVCSAALVKTSEKLYTLPISGDVNGLLHLTVFDPAFHPVAERLVFLNPFRLNYGGVEIYSEQLSGEPRGLNELQMSVDSINWINYAVSVSDTTLPDLSRQDNILSAFWLTGDLLNPVQNPGKFFTHPDPVNMETLDAILISEKWKRFDWNDVLNDKFPVIRYPPLPYLSYSGTLRRGRSLKPNEEVNLLLSFPDSSIQLINTKSDITGSFVISNLAFREDAKVYYQLNTKKSGATLIDVNFDRMNRFMPFTGSFPPSVYTVSTPVSSYQNPEWVNRSASSVKEQKDLEKKYITLQEVIVESKKRTAKEELNDQLSSGLFRSNSETVFDFVNEEQYALGYTNILQWLQGRVAGVTVRYSGLDYVAYIRNQVAALYIDEIRADPSLISTLSVSDIAMIKVIKGPFGLMTSSGGGTIAIYTKRGNISSRLNPDPALPNSTIRGYDSAKKYFNPDYSDTNVPHLNHDARIQLAWRPDLLPVESADRVSVLFYNNDVTGKFRLTVQGISENGLPVFLEKLLSPAKKPM